MKILLAAGAMLALGWTQCGSPEPPKPCCVLPPGKALADQIAEAEAKMATDPRYRFNFHTLSAEKALEDHRPAEAVPHYQEASRLQPENPGPPADLGYVYLRYLHDTKPVLDLFRRAMKLGGTVMIPVRHAHSPWTWCEGTLRLGRGQFGYSADSVRPAFGGLHGLTLEQAEVKSFGAVAGTAGTMRMATAKYSMDFIPLEQPRAICDLTLTLDHEATGGTPAGH